MVAVHAFFLLVMNCPGTPWLTWFLDDNWNYAGEWVSFKNSYFRNNSTSASIN
jgi:hypothetical protein